MPFKQTARIVALVLVAAIVAYARPSNAQLFTIKPTSADDAPPVDLSQIQRFTRKGFGDIRGHLGVPNPTNNGDEILFSDNDVFLVPNVPYARWYFMDYLTRNFKRFANRGFQAKSKDDRIEFAHFDEGLLKYTRHVKTDDQGRFEFAGIPTGNYFVVSVVNSVENGSVAHYGFFGGGQISDYKVEYLQLLGDDPGIDVSGDSPSTASQIKRYVPNSRSAPVICFVRSKPAPCIDAVDLDQFTGGRSDF